MPEQANILEAIKNVVREEIRSMEERLENKMSNFRDEILTHVDAVMKEVKTIREEQPIMSHALVDQEKRIDRLEATAYAK